MATNVDWQAKRQQAQEAARAAKDWTVTYVVFVCVGWGNRNNGGR